MPFLPPNEQCRSTEGSPPQPVSTTNSSHAHSITVGTDFNPHLTNMYHWHFPNTEAGVKSFRWNGNGCQKKLLTDSCLPPETQQQQHCGKMHLHFGGETRTIFFPSQRKSRDICLHPCGTSATSVPMHRATRELELPFTQDYLGTRVPVKSTQMSHLTWISYVNRRTRCHNDLFKIHSEIAIRGSHKKSGKSGTSA